MNDQDTNLYYLQSRYYNPKTGRFLNADAFTSTGQGILGNNGFTYCNNNPVNYVDANGTWPKWLTDAEKEVNRFIYKTGLAFADSCYLTTEFGCGFGAKANVQGVDIEASAIIATDEYTYYMNGEVDSARRMSFSIQALVFDQASLGLDLQRTAPIEDARRHGIAGAKKAENSSKIGLYLSNFGIGYNNSKNNDFTISTGVAGYLGIGGGVEVGINLTRFVNSMLK